MSCKLCNKQLFYESSWVVPDAGYGDSDYGGINTHQVAVRICPNCGEIKINSKLPPEEKEKYAIEMLTKIICNNKKHFQDSELAESKIQEQVKMIFKLGNERFNIKILEKNKLTFENNCLKCSCGEIITKGVDVADALLNLETSKMNFCQNCGKKLKPLIKEVSDFEEPIDFITSSKKTWDRGE